MTYGYSYNVPRLLSLSNNVLCHAQRHVFLDGPDSHSTESFHLLSSLLIYRTNVVMNYTEVEGKVREATNDEPWGPTGPLMQELAHATFTYEHFPEVMSMLWKRMLQDNKTNWRRTYKVTFAAAAVFIRNRLKILFFSFSVFGHTEFVAAELFGAKWFGACCHVVQGTYLRFANIRELHVHR